jgi:hypothetical protein
MLCTGLCTGIGGAFAFCAERTNKRLLALSLAVRTHTVDKPMALYVCTDSCTTPLAVASMSAGEENRCPGGMLVLEFPVNFSSLHCTPPYVFLLHHPAPTKSHLLPQAAAGVMIHVSYADIYPKSRAEFESVRCLAAV